MSGPARPQTLTKEQLDAAIAAAPSHELVTTRHVSCVGSGGALGHPKVYYEIGAKGTATCRYCDKLFVYVDA